MLNNKEIKKMEIEEFNENYPIGTPVEYYPFVGDNGDLLGKPLKSKTTSKAWVMCGAVVVMIMILGKPGCVDISQLKLI